MENCPVCGSELSTSPRKYLNNPDGEFLVSTIYDCPNDGHFALLLGSNEVLALSEMARLKASQYLSGHDGKLRILSISLKDNGEARILCRAWDYET